MDFALGFIAGVATCAFIAVVLILIRKPLAQMTAPVVQAIERRGIGGKGFVVEPEADEVIVRREIIEKNREKGQDTPIAELL